ncbi:glycine-rich protein [Pseudonocardia sp. 73-21]|uniref:OmpL47-type beta-barrel domain-containing protein n=1 Tax=Pseudonocardia sp. 73-21 TaxID=1895809 RepID=UPI0009698118|nr:glycine-rich protein [Pseudonocardia sp. 73-21]OJY54321.1 MAG: hypothetical protein BGP03_04215 [Pseudonocardia sp. 73-21]
MTCTYGATGAEQSFTVPTGVTSVQVSAIGAAGAPSYGGAAAGRGATVTGTLNGLVGGQQLYVEVGGIPANTTACYPKARCVGGFNGGATSRYGGGGGGASDIRTVSGTATTGSLQSRLIVAGGGGGGGIPGAGCDDAGTPGGDAGGPGGTSSCSGVGTSTGGRQGSATAGAGGTPSGQAGTLGAGGNGGGNTGGGGGGGLYGGGGGGGLVFAVGSGTNTAGGGGGGGSSLVPAGGSQGLTASPASVTITYSVAPADTTPPTSTVTSGPGSANGLPVVTITGTATFKTTAGAPMGTITGTCYTTRGLALTFNATDTGSGVASLTYAATGAQTIPATTTPTLPATVTVTARGTTTVTYSAKDKAGNAETPHSQTVWVAPNGAPFACTAPATTFTPPGHGSVTIAGTATVFGRSVPFNQTITY